MVDKNILIESWVMRTFDSGVPARAAYRVAATVAGDRHNLCSCICSTIFKISKYNTQPIVGTTTGCDNCLFRSVDLCGPHRLVQF